MTESNHPHSSLDAMLARVENDVRLVRRDLDQMLGPVEQALATFRRALEDEAAIKYASSHNMARPGVVAISAEVAARNLLLAVERVVQLRGVRPQRGVEQLADASSGVAVSSSSTEPPSVVEPRASLVSGAEGSAEGLSASAEVRPLSDALPKVAAQCDAKKLAIVGALSGRKRPLPEPLEMAVEWIDTADGGTHAAGNLSTRIRQGRIFGLIICEQSISHKHSEPLVAAARGANVPVGFAGKGGGAAIARALRAIEEQLP